MNNINVLERLLLMSLWQSSYLLRLGFSISSPAVKLGAKKMDSITIQAIQPQNKATPKLVTMPATSDFCHKEVEADSNTLSRNLVGR